MSNEDFRKSWKEGLDSFKPSVDDEQYQVLDVGYCDCAFSKEEIARLVALCDEEGYIVPRGLTREERRKYMKEVGRRSSYGLTKEKAESISKNTEDAYKSRLSFSSEDALRLGDSMIEHYLELTNESDKGDIVVDL